MREILLPARTRFSHPATSKPGLPGTPCSLQRLHAEHRFDRAARRQRMAEKSFDRRQRRQPVAKQSSQRFRFHRVVVRRAGAMRTHVIISAGRTGRPFQRPAALRQARRRPSGCGAVAWIASQLAPQPVSRARIFAPRARAVSSASSTSIAAPSPRLMPVRAASKGRQPFGSSKSSEPKPFNVSRDNESPAAGNHKSASPLSINSAAAAMAIAPAEQAVEKVRHGPRAPSCRAHNSVADAHS